MTANQGTGRGPNEARSIRQEWNRVELGGAWEHDEPDMAFHRLVGEPNRR